MVFENHPNNPQKYSHWCSFIETPTGERDDHQERNQMGQIPFIDLYLEIAEGNNQRPLQTNQTLACLNLVLPNA